MTRRELVSVTILGRGRLGRGLARALRASGVDVTLASARRLPRMLAPVVVLACPDPSIASVAAAIAPRLERSHAVLHCAGRHDRSVLAPCAAAGAAIGAMHPLASFADPQHPPSLEGCAFVIDGDRRAIAAATAIARAVGARPLHAAVHGPAYHAAAALSANGAAALASLAVRVLAELGVPRREAERGIGALLRTVGENIERIGVPAALTGPIVRGDADTVRAHRAALAFEPAAGAAYRAIAPAILACAIEAGLDDDRASAIRDALD